jgi:DNA end-binding protein Ku
VIYAGFACVRQKPARAAAVLLCGGSGCTMARQSFWKGYLKLSLVTCPVAMAPAISASEKIRFHTLNRSTGNRVESRYVDAETGKPVADDDIARGYQNGDDSFVLLDDAELDAVALESTRTIDIETFVPAASIAWVYYDTPHYLTPNDRVGEEAFSVIRDAMEATQTGGIARLVLYRRERAVLLLPSGAGIVVWTLRYGDEVRPDNAYFAAIADEKPGAKPLALVKQLIEARTVAWSPKLVRDPVEERLHDIIAAKKKGRRAVSKPKPAARTGNVVNIMDALRRSIAADK